MGEAKRRASLIANLKADRERWMAGLSSDELKVLRLADRLEERLVRGKGFTEGCYHLAFFMTRYLADKGVAVTPVIGWMNDGTWEGVASHAWIEYGGKMTDVSMTRTSHPEAQPTGAMIVLDRVIRKGEAEYTYYQNDDPVALKATAMLRADPQLGSVQAMKEAEHRKMLEIADPGHPERIDAYLANAPAGLQFADIRRMID